MTKQYSLLEINTDGGSRGNPGPAGIGVYASSENKMVFTLSECIGDTTNNVAEYSAVIHALKKIQADDLHIEKTKFILDSELIVKQITGLYKVKQDHLKILKSEIVSLIENLRKTGNLKIITFSHVLREKNKLADKLVNEALDR